MTSYTNYSPLSWNTITLTKKCHLLFYVSRIDIYFYLSFVWLSFVFYRNLNYFEL